MVFFADVLDRNFFADCEILYTVLDFLRIFTLRFQREYEASDLLLFFLTRTTIFRPGFYPLPSTVISAHVGSLIQYYEHPTDTDLG